MAEDRASQKKQQDTAQMQRAHEYRRTLDYSVLLETGFEPAGEALWKRNGIFFGREAALQHAWRETR